MVSHFFLPVMMRFKAQPYAPPPHKHLSLAEPKHQMRINQMMYVHGLDSTVIAAAAPVVGTRWAFVEVLELDPTPLS